MSVSYGGDSITFADSSVLSSGQTGFKNRIINGDMRVSQRGAAVNVAAAGGSTYGSCDRFTLINYFGNGWINTEQSTDAPSNFINSLKLTVGAAAPLSGTTGFYTALVQNIEGYNIADLYGSTVKLSFWVKSSVVGTYSVTFQNAATVSLDSNSRLYVAEYTISQANTWEKKSITVDLAAGSASGTWNKTNGAGLAILWNLGAESNRKGNAYLNTWGTVGTTYNLMSGSSTQWASNAGATFYISGVQLEKGSTESNFDYRPYGTELALCQRYFYAAGANDGGYTISVGHGISAGGSSVWRASIFLPVPLRTTQSITETNMEVWNPSFGSTAISSISTIYYLDRGIFLEVDVTATSNHGITGGYPAWMQTKGSGGKSTFDINAEL
jgi:hypothetical protein